LLASLKTSQPQEYDRAIRDISRTTERLSVIEQRDPLQYELEVATWRAQSRVQLLAAKLNMGSSDELQRQLREAVAAQNTAKLALLKYDRQRVADRLGKLDSEISRLETDREQVIEQQVRMLTKAAAEGKSGKLAPKNAGKAGKNKPTN